MNLRKITDPGEAEQLYREHMAVDFPPAERLPLPFFLQMIERPDSSLHFCEKDGQDAAYAVFRETDGYMLLNYFAVYENWRGKGVGSELLRAIGDFYTDKRGILLEVEHTAYAKDEADAVVCRKRIAFYERCGYVCLPDFDLLLFGEHYHVMVLPVGEDKTDDQEYIYGVLCRMYSDIPPEHAVGAIEWVHSDNVIKKEQQT